MQGNFTITLVEIFAYLVPGFIALTSLVYWITPTVDINDLLQRAWFIAAFFVVSFVLGHILTMLSVYVLKLRMFVMRRVLKRESRQEQLSFYPKLSECLRHLFGSEISYTDEYSFSLRLVTENMPNSAQKVDRLYALTLFSRNLVVSCIMASGLFIASHRTLSFISFILAILFFIRYFQLEAVTGETVLRSAYIFLRMRKEKNNENSPNY